MKCPNCGGEVDSQSTACPYCNSVYEPGRLFQLELAEKMEKNKLLAKFVLKSRTPDMVQMMLTRSIISFLLAAIVFMVVAFGIYMLAENGLHREPEEGTYAWKYIHGNDSRIENEMLREYMNEIVVAVDTGEPVSDTALDYVLLNSLYEIQEDKDSEQSHLIQAFMSGYLQMTEEEISEFMQVEDDYYTRHEAADALCAKLLSRLGGDE